MERCGDCKYLNERTCTWWLQAVTVINGRNCYVPPDSAPNYPLVPTPSIHYPRVFIYPTAHKRCFMCGIDLTGRQRHYCGAGHREMYNYRWTWVNLRELIWRRDDYKCVICGISLPKLWEAEIDHIQAVALEGDYWNPTNLQTLCHDCHSTKTGEDRVKINNKLRREIIEANHPTLEVFLGLNGGLSNDNT